MSRKEGINRIFLISLFILVASVVFISADFTNGDPSYNIQTTYGPGADIVGWINSSLEDEAIDSEVEDNQGNSIDLIDLLKIGGLISDVDYTCSPIDCSIGYSTTGLSESKKNFSLSSGQEVIIGFVFNKDLEDVESVDFDVSSDATQSCKNQLKIDFFADKTYVLGNNESSGSLCSGIIRRGCFSASKTTTEYPLSDTGMHCQRIKFTEAPSFRATAWVKQTDVNDVITLRVFEEDDLEDPLESCVVSDTVTGATGTHRSCDIDLITTEEKDYFVCVQGKIDSSSKIRGYEDTGNGCGFYYEDTLDPEDYAFDFYIEGMMFDRPGARSFRDELPNGNSLAEMFEEYISDRYDSDLDCNVTDCIVPIKFIAGANQNLTIGNISIKYKPDVGVPDFITKTYRLTSSSAKVSTFGEGFEKITLDSANFTLPTTYKSYDYEMTLGGEKIFEETITIEKIPEIKSLYPVRTASKFTTTLEVTVIPITGVPISEYNWVIKNPAGTAVETQTTQTNIMNYEFPGIGVYTVDITVIDSSGKSATKAFPVTVNSPGTEVDRRLAEMQVDLTNIIEDINKLQKFYQDSVKQIINTDALNEKIKELLRAASELKASSNPDYGPIVSEIMNLNIPKSISEGTSTGSISFYPNLDVIDVEGVSGIAGGSYESGEESSYADSILEWQTSSISIKVEYTEINAAFERGTQSIMNVFKVHTKELTPIENQYYLFVEEMNNLLFDKDYNEKNSSGYIGILIDKPDKIIAFATSEDIGFSELPVFVSPSLDNLDLLEIIEGEQPGIKWALFILILFFLVIAGVTVYIVLQYWYKTKYETYLFKNRNYLFNLVNYIDTQRKKEVKESEIIKKLKSQGWNSEQITYVMRKYLGKRTGMWEIPIENILKKFRKSPGASGKPGSPSTPEGQRIASTGFAPRGVGARQGFGRPGQPGQSSRYYRK